MPESDEEEPLHGSRLDIRLSRPFFRFTGQNGLILATIMLVMAPAGWPISVRLFGKPVIELILVWIVAFAAFGIPFMLEAYNHRRWAMRGPDLWLRVSEQGIEFAQLVFRIRQYKFAWPDIRKWKMAEVSAKRRIILIETAKSRGLAIDPMDYVWTGYKVAEDQRTAIALELDIESLLKLYAGDRRGESAEPGGG
jgi:hypothetical protein